MGQIAPIAAHSRPRWRRWHAPVRAVSRSPGCTGEIRTPPFTAEGRIEAGQLLARLQAGKAIGMPHSRPLPSIGPRVHELRVRDAGHNWRIVYRIDPDAVIIAGVFAKQSKPQQQREFKAAERRLDRYDAATED